MTCQGRLFFSLPGLFTLAASLRRNWPSPRRTFSSLLTRCAVDSCSAQSAKAARPRERRPLRYASLWPQLTCLAMTERKVQVEAPRPGRPPVAAAAGPHVDRKAARDALGAYDFGMKTLRAWLGTYSVGVPAFLFTRETALRRLVQHEDAYRVALMFAIAIALQVALTFINKYTQWLVYARHSEPSGWDNKLTRWAEKVSEWIWIDLLFDFGTIVFLVMGTYWAFKSVVSL
jgi:hypothetical protein